MSVSIQLVCRRTLLLKLLEQLVVLSAQLRPLGKLVLAARGLELPLDLEVLCLHLALLGRRLGRRDGEEVYKRPELKARSVEASKVLRRHIPGC